MYWINNPREGKAPSFDVAVLQEYSNINVHHCKDWGWTDVGSFKAFTQMPEIKLEINNPTSIIDVDCSNITVLNRSENKIVLVGCQDIFVIVNGSNILIMSNQSDYDNKLKDIASKI